MEPMLENALALTPQEARIYSTILGATSSLPKSDPRYALVIGVTWWLLHRRRRMEQQLIRRRHFSRRLRRLMYLRWQLQRNNMHGISSAMRASEIAEMEDLSSLPEKKIWVKKDQSDIFWVQFDQGELSSEVFLKNFHMSQETFDFIYTELAEHLKKANTTMREPLPGKKRLAATLYRLATNAEYLKVASLFGIGKSTTTSLVRDVCEVIVTILRNKFLDLNIDQETLEEAEVKFEIPQVIGVLGSIDVFIVGSSWDWSESSPFSSAYSQSYALIFQAVVDHMGCFKHVSAGCPAGLSNVNALTQSNLDSHVKETISHLQKEFNGVQVPALIVADESHIPVSEEGIFYPWMLSPYKEHNLEQDEKKRKLNEKIHKAENVFEEAVAKVKSRWKIFHGKNGKINFNADAFENIALACCILHNICEKRGDPIDPNWSLDVQDSLFVRKGQPGSSTLNKSSDKMKGDADDSSHPNDEDNNMELESDVLASRVIRDTLATII